MQPTRDSGPTRGAAAWPPPRTDYDAAFKHLLGQPSVAADVARCLLRGIVDVDAVDFGAVQAIPTEAVRTWCLTWAMWTSPDWLRVRRPP